MSVYIMRLKPEESLKEGIVKFCKEKGISSGFVVGCAGSLSQVRVRLADAREFRDFDQNLEIVSLQGSLSKDGVHLHISLADNTGAVYGGHLVEGIVHTTAEIMTISCDDRYVFSRVMDETTGYKELVICEK